MVNEASYLNTGYSRYGHELLSRLSQKYDVAELGSYGDARDARSQNLGWKFYGCLPTNEQEHREYNSHPQNQFGRWKFESVCLDFQPDVVIDIRDYWYHDYQAKSPYRKCFKWFVMPTVDSVPQSKEWLDTYSKADAVFTYQDWGKNVIQRESGGKIKVLDSAPMAADECFKPVADKVLHKQKLGLGNIQIIGTVMRNQKRKLFPDLFKSFREFLDKTKRNDIFLYCHTGFPDLGWNIPFLLKKYGICSRTLFTYSCQRCGTSFPSFFSDAKTTCPNCNQPEAMLSNVQLGVNNQVLADIVNMFDVYVQYSNSEGFGAPMLEAAACGVPVMGTDYSSMEDVVRKLNGTPIKVHHYITEPETNTIRAIPSNEHLIAELTNFFFASTEERQRLSRLARQGYELHYGSWDRIADKWISVIDKLGEGNWRLPPRILPYDDQIPEGLNNFNFVKYLILQVLKEPSLLDGYYESSLIRDLNYGATLKGFLGSFINENSADSFKFIPFNRNDAINQIKAIAHHRNICEQKRKEVIGL